MTFLQATLRNNATFKKALPGLLSLLPLLPALAQAEGAVRVLDCNTTQVCDAAGTCEAASDAVIFRMSPESLSADGSGTYKISYQDIEADMQASAEAGPFYWTRDVERNTLLASSETRFLWHKLQLAPTPQASILFLDCTLQ